MLLLYIFKMDFHLKLLLLLLKLIWCCYWKYFVNFLLQILARTFVVVVASSFIFRHNCSSFFSKCKHLTKKQSNKCFINPNIFYDDITFRDVIRWNYRPQAPVVTGHEVKAPQGFDYTITLHPDVNTVGKGSYINDIILLWERKCILLQRHSLEKRVKMDFSTWRTSFIGKE